MNPVTRPLTLATALAVAVLAALTGCANAAKDIAAVPAPALAYQGYDCEQLAAEAQRIHGRSSQLGGRLDEAAKNDKTIAGVGVLVFWPALFALGGTQAQEAEYARLKGEYDAVMQTAVKKKCPGATAGDLAAASGPR